MAVFVVSDMHLMDRQEAFLFNFEKERAFVRLCDFIQDEDELILAGDIFDLTGMTPCRVGQLEFFNESVPLHLHDKKTIEACSKIRTTEELLLAIKRTFPDFFNCLNKLALKKQLSYIPGNHDCDFLQKSGQRIFEKVLGITDGFIQWKRTVIIGNELAVIHGNEFDPANQTDRGCQNPGFVFTSALYHAVLPALRMHGVHPILLDALPAVRPEEESVIGIQHYLNSEDCKKILLGLARLIQKNGFFLGKNAIPTWFLSHSFPIISKLVRQMITPERVRSVLPKEDQIKSKARKGCESMLDQLIKKNPNLKKAIIIAGHTHQLDATDRYVNLGTWNDHISGLSPAQIQKADTRLPVFVMKEPGQEKLFNIHSILQKQSLWDCPVMWSQSNSELVQDHASIK